MKTLLKSYTTPNGSWCCEITFNHKYFCWIDKDRSEARRKVLEWYLYESNGPSIHLEEEIDIEKVKYELHN